MGLKMDVGRADRQRIEIAASTKMVEEQMQTYIAAVNRFTSSKQGMQGSAFDSARSWFTKTHIPLAKGIIAYAKELNLASGKFVDNYHSEVDSASLDEDKLKAQIKRLDAQEAQFHRAELMLKLVGLVDADARKSANSMNKAAKTLDNTEDKLRQKLRRLQNYDPVSATPFSRLDAMWSRIQAGIRTINGQGHFNGQSFTTMGTDISWAVVLTHNYAEALVDEMPVPHSMSPQEATEYRHALYKHADDLADGGWADASIQAFVAYANKHVQKDLGKDGNKIAKVVKEYYNQSQSVGSSVFLAMWNADTLADSEMSGGETAHAQAKLATLMKVARMPNDLNGSVAQTKGLLKKFDKGLAPDNNFWDNLAKTTQTAFPNGIASELDNVALGRLVHQYRYVISAQQMQYVRDTYKGDGESDRDALIKYLKHSGTYTLTESARLHQKLNKDGNPPAGFSGTNIKIVQNFHTEFILDGHGNLINEIDPEHEPNDNENGVVNGASFNYANKNDSMHRALDVNYNEEEYLGSNSRDGNPKSEVVQQNDPSFRLERTTGYRAPSYKMYGDEKVKFFAKNGLSARDRNQIEVTKFEFDLTK